MAGRVCWRSKVVRVGVVFVVAVVLAAVVGEPVEVVSF